jgi:mgtE-like transporter
VVTIGLSLLAVRRSWDMDNVAAPLVTAAADVVTLPALALATFAVGFRLVTPLIGVGCVVVAVALPVQAWRTRRPELRRILAESAPVLAIGGALSTVAGAVFESRLDNFLSVPVLLVMIPPFLASTGALGGILTSRVASGLHLGSITPTGWPGFVARRNMVLIAALRVPTLVAIAGLGHVLAVVTGMNTPGFGRLLAVVTIAGTLTTVATLAVAWYGSIGAYRLGLDPDNHGIPLVTSVMDLFGAAALVIAIATVGL